MIGIGRFGLNLHALLARLLFRWHRRVMATLLLSCGALLVATGTLPPVWRGRVALEIAAVPGARVLVNGRPWPRPVFAGEHLVEAVLPDGRRSRVLLRLAAGASEHLVLPAPLPPPRIQTITAAAPGAVLDGIWWADGGWRIASRAVAEPAPTPGRVSTTPTPLPPRTVALTHEALEPLPTLDAYGGRADLLHLADRRLEAVYRVEAAPGSAGVIEIRGWEPALRRMPVGGPITLLRWSPTGQALLLAEALTSGGQQIHLLRPHGSLVGIVAVPGPVHEVHWSPDGAGAVLVSSDGERHSLTLLRAVPPLASRALADVPGSAPVPLQWTTGRVEWLAPDTAGHTILWQAGLDTLLPEPGEAVVALAFTRLPDGGLRVVRRMGSRVVVGRMVGRHFVEQGELPGVPADPALRGRWSPAGKQLVLEAGPRAWLVSWSTGAANAWSH